MIIHIKSMPLPISVNKAYAQDFRTKRRFKSKCYSAYEMAIKFWSVANEGQLKAAVMTLEELLVGQALHVKRTFYQQRKKIITKDNRPKRNDATNLIKVGDDALSALLGIDDCVFWSGEIHKIPVETEQEERMDIEMHVIQLDDLK